MIESAIRERKRKPDSSISFRVWRMHRRFKHVSLRVLSNMLRRGLIINCDVTSFEIDLLASHQDYMACALSRWKKLNEEPSSGLRPLLAGQVWSTDYHCMVRMLCHLLEVLLACLSLFVCLRDMELFS